MTTKPLRIALTKGRLEKDTVALMERVGLDCQSLHQKGRRLILPLPQAGTEVVLAKAADVITYVESGVCDMGIVGKDTIQELASHLYELLDLGFGRCRFALAVKQGDDFFGGYGPKTIATKYPKIARSYFQKQGLDVSVVKIEGSVELAPLLGLADGIVDIVETGATLRENGLAVLEEIVPISARLIANKASFKFKREEIRALAERTQKSLAVR